MNELEWKCSWVALKVRCSTMMSRDRSNLAHLRLQVGCMLLFLALCTPILLDNPRLLDARPESRWAMNDDQI
jgi:hypothetical protein